MLSKNQLMILSTCLLAGISSAAVAQTTPDAKTGAKKATSCQDDSSKCYNRSHLQLGPYLNKDRLFDGSELIINVPSVREEARLLESQFELEKTCQELGIPAPVFPRLTVSGKIEGLYTYESEQKASEFQLDAAELDLYLQATHWLSSYVAIDYSAGNPKDNRIFMNRGFVTLGNLAVTPFYISAGKMYVPFGRYASNMVSTPLTLALARTRANAAVIGFQQTGSNALHAEVYTYQGITQYYSNGKGNHVEYGADVGYQYKIASVSGELGASYISNLTDSTLIHGTFFNRPSAYFLNHKVPAYDTYGSIAFGQFNVLAEYVHALKYLSIYNSNTMSNLNTDSNPSIDNGEMSALNAEVSYNFKSFSKPSSVAVGYTTLKHASQLQLPAKSYLAVYNINIIKNTNLAVEFRHDVNYPNNPHKTDNVVSAQFDFFF